MGWRSGRAFINEPRSDHVTTAVLWTGGKDSALALHRVRASVRELVTFVPPNAEFKAHDLRLIAAQARALGLPHRLLVVEAPYELGYERALSELRESGIERVVTGDIAEVAGQPNFIVQRAERVGLDVALPLWGVDREAHMTQLVSLGFDVIFTYVNEPWLDASWVGRHLSASSLAELRALSAKNGCDLAGENGEYHSMVLAGPGWRSEVRVEGSVRSAPPAHRLELSRIHELTSRRPPETSPAPESSR